MLFLFLYSFNKHLGALRAVNHSGLFGKPVPMKKSVWLGQNKVLPLNLRSFHAIVGRNLHLPRHCSSIKIICIPMNLKELQKVDKQPAARVKIRNSRINIRVEFARNLVGIHCS